MSWNLITQPHYPAFGMSNNSKPRRLLPSLQEIICLKFIPEVHLLVYRFLNKALGPVTINAVHMFNVVIFSQFRSFSRDRHFKATLRAIKGRPNHLLSFHRTTPSRPSKLYLNHYTLSKPAIQLISTGKATYLAKES